MYTNIFLIFLIFILGFFLTYFLTPIIAKLMIHFHKVGLDIHKLERPEVPEMCGLSIVIAMTSSIAVLILFIPQNRIEFSFFILAILVASIIGFIDDLKSLGAKIKPFLTAFSCVPLIVAGIYSPYPILPFIGRVRLTLVYPLLLPFAFAVPSNAVNMMDVFNGSMTGTCSIITLTLVICLLISGKLEYAAIASALLGCLIAFHLFNKHPAKVFAGDTGSLFIGASIGALAVVGQIEVATVVAMIPYIMNAFYGLTTFGGLFERKELKSRPIRLLQDGRLDITRDKKAPITLTRMILTKRPLSECDVVNIMILLTIISSILAIITQLIILVSPI